MCPIEPVSILLPLLFALLLWFGRSYTFYLLIHRRYRTLLIHRLLFIYRVSPNIFLLGLKYGRQNPYILELHLH